jgi:ankyrin repeat protein
MNDATSIVSDIPGVCVADRTLGNVASHYHQETVNLLLAAGAQPSPDCLINAVRSGNIEAVKRFLDLGVDANRSAWRRPNIGAREISIETALSEAVRVSFEEAFNLFEERHYVAKAMESELSLVPVLIAASEVGDADLVDRLARLRDCPVDGRQGNEFLDLRGRLGHALDGAFRSKSFRISDSLLDFGVLPSSDSIVYAVRSHDYGLLDMTLELVPDLWSSNNAGLGSLIATIAEWGDQEVIKRILRFGFPLGRRFPFPETTTIELDLEIEPPLTLLTAAVLFKNFDIVHELLRGGASLNSPGSVLSPLAAAVFINHLPLVDHFLSLKANPVDDMAVMFACSRDNTVVIEKILQEYSRQYPTGTKRFGSRALEKAIAFGHLSQIHLLVGIVDMNVCETIRCTDSYDQFNAIGIAILHNRPDVLRIFLENGANPNSISCRPFFNDTGLTAVLQAAESGKLPLVQELVKHGANLHVPAQYRRRRTALQYAVESGNINMVQYLLQLGVEPNEAPAIQGGATSLQLAAMKGHVGIAEILIGAGADVNACPARSEGRTAFEGATEYGRIDAMLYLLEKGADMLSNDARQYRRAILFAKRNNQNAACDLAEKLYHQAQKQADQGVSVLRADESFAPITTARNHASIQLNADLEISNEGPATRMSDVSSESGTFNIDDWIANPSPGPVCAMGGF